MKTEAGVAVFLGLTRCISVEPSRLAVFEKIDVAGLAVLQAWRDAGEARVSPF